MSFWSRDQAPPFAHTEVLAAWCVPTYFSSAGNLVLLLLFFVTSSQNIYPNPTARGGKTRELTHFPDVIGEPLARAKRPKHV